MIFVGGKWKFAHFGIYCEPSTNLSQGIPDDFQAVHHSTCILGKFVPISRGVIVYPTYKLDCKCCIVPPLPKKRTHNLRTQFGDWSRVLSIFWGCYIHTYEHQLCELRASKAGGHQPYTKNTQEGATDMPLLKCPRFAWVQPSICAIRSILSILLLLLLQQFLLFDGFGICKERLEESAGAFLGSCAFVVFSRALSGGSKYMNMLTTFTFKTISTAGVTREVSPGRQPCPWPYARIFATCP